MDFDLSSPMGFHLSSKEQKFNAVYEAVLVILNSQAGLSGVNHSALSRISGVSRPWIYRYIGKTKQAVLLKTSEDCIAGLFSRRPRPPIRTLADLQRETRLDTLYFLAQAEKYPRVVPLFFIYFKSEGPIGSLLREAFGAYSKSCMDAMSESLNISRSEAESLAEMLTTFRLGLAFFLTKVLRTERGLEPPPEPQKIYQHLLQLL